MLVIKKKKIKCTLPKRSLFCKFIFFLTHPINSSPETGSASAPTFCHSNTTETIIPTF